MTTGRKPFSLTVGEYPGEDYDRAWRELVFPQDYRNPTPRARYHLVVIGAGPAGLVTAIAAAGLGARVALVERQAMGGDCLNVGCVPSKALLEFTRRNPGGGADDALAWMRRVRAEIARHDSVERYRQQGVDVFLGTARFLDRKSIAVGKLRLRARRFVIATGARAAMPPVPGLASRDPLTNESVFDLVELPRRLAILGAGPIGCEMAQAMARLGVEVHLFEMADRVLPGELTAAGEVLAQALRADGVTLHLGSLVSEASIDAGEPTLHTDGKRVTAGRVLVAAGRRANVEDLQLHNAGVEVRDGLITVDSRLRTTNRKIFAAGDVCSRLKFTHHADAQARIVTRNALFAPTATTTALTVPRCTYTDPEVAHVGRTQEELDQAGIPYDRYRLEFANLDRGKAAGNRPGFVEVTARKGRANMLGATIVGEDAGEQIAGLCLAMANGLGLGALGKAILPYPTRGEYLRRLADDYNRTRLTPLARKIMETWLDYAAR